MIHDFRSASCWLCGILMGAAYMASGVLPWLVFGAVALLVIPYGKIGEWINAEIDERAQKRMEEFQLIGRR